MKIEVHENRIELTPENHLENEAINRWKDRPMIVANYGAKGLTNVCWSDRRIDIFTMTIDFREQKP